MFRHLTTLRRYRAPLKSLSTLAAAHSSWFKLEDQGMKKFDLLARGSGFYTLGPQTGLSIALVSAHVAAPHRFRNYFPHQWLSHVRDENCQSVFESRGINDDDSHKWIATYSLSSGFRHAKLDVAAFILDEGAMEGVNVTSVLKLEPGEDIESGQGVVVGGFGLIGESGSGSEGVVGREVEGVVSEIIKVRGFVDTGEVETEMGMCGGPVVLKEDREVCVGILEGLVPRVGRDGAESSMHQRVGGHSVFIQAAELMKFVHDVETEYIRGRKEA